MLLKAAARVNHELVNRLFPRVVTRYVSAMAVLMRLISLILIVIALMLLGADAVSSLEKGGELTVRSLDTVWGMVIPQPGAFKVWLHDHAAFIAQPVYSFLASPGWGVTGVIGVILAFVFGRRLGPE